MLTRLNEVINRPANFNRWTQYKRMRFILLLLFASSICFICSGCGGGFSASSSTARKHLDLPYNFVKSSSPVAFFCCLLASELPKLRAISEAPNQLKVAT